MSSGRDHQDTHTPKLTVCDSRGCEVRIVDFYRCGPEQTADIRIHRQNFNLAGRIESASDPRLGGMDGDITNLSNLFSLSGAALYSVSVDAGWRLNLPGEAGESRTRWDSGGTRRIDGYDSLLRLTDVTEQTAQSSLTVERLTYGSSQLELSPRNLCGRLIRHDDTAGSLFLASYSLLGTALTHDRRFTLTADSRGWPVQVDERDALLETDSALTQWQGNALGDTVVQVDAGQNRQRFEYGVSGKLKAAYIQLHQAQERAVLSGLSFNAFNQVEQEMAGNGVVSRARYSAVDGRLTDLESAISGQAPLQYLHYEYDAVGNVVSIEDRAQLSVFFRNQQIDFLNTYCYDSRYQLIESTGYEAIQPEGWRSLCDYAKGFDSNELANYREQYHYDAAGNLQTLVHSGGNNFTRRLATAAGSNRSLPYESATAPTDDDIANGFDANGNPKELFAGQVLAWDVRNQLQRVVPIVRTSGEDDSETYVYDHAGQRVRKLRRVQAQATAHLRETRYLPGLEVHRDSSGDKIWQVIVMQAGRSLIRFTQWVSGKPDGVSDHLSYALRDHLQSSTVELNECGVIISRESYYPFGGTAWWMYSGAGDASEKTTRYSGKERDATGLYYYGMRYYGPWLQRWISPDPAGVVDGLNLYRFVRNNPLTLHDRTGAHPTRADSPPAYALAAYERMFNHGRVWAGLAQGSESGVETIARISRQNVSKLEGELESEQQYRLAARIAEIAPVNTWITHFSESDFTTPQGVDFKSLVALQKMRGDSGYEGHSLGGNIPEYANHDFAFFAFEAGGTEPLKSSSAFGPYRYHAKLSDLGEKAPYAHMEVTDLMRPNTREISDRRVLGLGWLKESGDASGFKSRTGRPIDREHDLLFYGADMLKGLGNKIAADLTALSPATQDAVVEWTSGDRPLENVSEVINAFYRPQVLVPGGLKLNPRQFILKHLGGK